MTSSFFFVCLVLQIIKPVMNDFGAIEEPTSRAFWGSEDLDDDTTSTFTLEWLTESPTVIKTLVIVAGNVVTGITERCVTSNAERVCTVNSTAEFNVAALYKLNNDVYVFIVTPSVDLTTAGMFIDNISDVISKSEKIIAFTNENISHLQGAERNTVSPTLWRSLSTTKGRQQRMSTVARLKNPNFIAGVAAGVLAYAEFMDLPAVLYILYVADDAYDTETAEPVIKLFTEMTNCPLPKLDSTSKTYNTNKLKLYI